MDVYLARLQWDTNAMLQGIQQAIESFRNQMLEVDAETQKYVPKTSPGVKVLIDLIENEMRTRQIIYEHETRKKISHDT